MKHLRLCNHTLTPALQLPVIFASDHEENHLAEYDSPSQRASRDTERLLAKLDEIVVESLRSENFEEGGAR